MTRLCFRFLADQFFISKAFASERSRRFHKPISVSSFASVESKSLFVQISEKVKRFYRNISASNATVSEATKSFHPLV